MTRDQLQSMDQLIQRATDGQLWLEIRDNGQWAFADINHEPLEHEFQPIQDADSESIWHEVDTWFRCVS